MVKRQVDAGPETPATVAADDASSADPIVHVGEMPVPRSQLASFYATGQIEWTPELLNRLSVVDYALITGDYSPLDAVIAGFLAEENAKVDRLARTFRQDRCRRCDHLRSYHRAGPCGFALCSCPGPEPAG